MFTARKSEPAPAPVTSTSSHFAEPMELRDTVTSFNSPKKPVGSNNHSIVNSCLTMRGDLESNGDILVQGKVLGNIKCNLLIVDADALVDGGIDAENVIIRGRTKGTITANRVHLEKTADVDSEISQNVFCAEEGARVRGTLKMKQSASDATPAKAG